jgi:hypothetical protein
MAKLRENFAAIADGKAVGRITELQRIRANAALKVEDENPTEPVRRANLPGEPARLPVLRTSASITQLLEPSGAKPSAPLNPTPPTSAQVDTARSRGIGRRWHNLRALSGDAHHCAALHNPLKY